VAGAATVWLGRNSHRLYRHFNGELDPAVRGYTEPIRSADASFYLLPLSTLAVDLLLILIGRFRGAD